jgi:Domain of unknown function (DUF4157)
VPAPVLEAPAKVDETKADERGHEDAPSERTSAPLFGAIAAADPAAHPVTRGVDLRTKSHVLLRVQRSAGNRAAAEWISGLHAEPLTVARTACCDGCASGGSCTSSAGDDQRDEHTGQPAIQRIALNDPTDEHTEQPAPPMPPIAPAVETPSDERRLIDEQAAEPITNNTGPEPPTTEPNATTSLESLTAEPITESRPGPLAAEAIANSPTGLHAAEPITSTRAEPLTTEPNANTPSEPPTAEPNANGPTEPPTAESIENDRPEPLTVARSACCDGCASGGPCTSSTGDEQSDEQAKQSQPAAQRSAVTADEPGEAQRLEGDEHNRERSGESGDAAGTPLQRTAVGSDGTKPVQRRAQDSTVPVQRGIIDDAAQAVLSRLRSSASAFVARIRAFAGRVWSRVSAVAERVGAALHRAAAAVVERLGAVFAALRQRLEGMLTRVQGLMERIGQRMRQIINRVSGLIRRAVDALKSGLRGLLERIKSIARSVIDNLKNMGRATFAPMTGKCLDQPAAEGAKARFEGLAEPAEAEVGDAATGGLADLTTQFGTHDASTAAEVGGLEATADTGRSQASADRDALTGAADTGQADIETRSTAAIDEVRASSTHEVSGVEGQIESGASDVEGQKSAGSGGLSGLLSGAVAAIAGIASQVVSSANRDADQATTGLRGQLSTLLGGLRRVVDSVLGILGIDVRKIAAKVAEIVRVIRERVNAILDTIIRTVLDLVRRGRSFLADLRERWRNLLSRATAGWNSLRTFLSRMRNRAAAALFNTCGDACALDSAKKEGRQLDAAILPQISFKALRGGARRPAPDRIAEIQRELEDGGQPLPSGTRAPMEAAFGADLSSTRVHTGATAAGLASGMNARAFTIGDDIAFGLGEFQPGSIHGDALIAHEVAHVLQQRRASATGGPATTTDDSAAEHDADHSAFTVVARMWAGAQNGVADIAANAGPRIQSGLALRRCPSSKCCETPAPSGPLAAVKAEGNVDNPRAVDLLTGKRNKEEGGDVYGLTGVGYGHALKDLQGTKASASEKCNQTCKPNVSQYPTFSLSPFFFVAAGRYPDFQFNENTQSAGARNFSVAKTGPCKGKSRPRVTIVTDDLARLVKAAEVEHAKDLARAWDLSIGKYVAAVKELEGGFCVDGHEKLTDNICTEEFRTRVGQRAGISFGGWTNVADCLVNQSKDRDTKGWHTVRDKTATKVGTKDCQETEVTPDAKQLTDINVHGQKEIIDDNAAACGAGGGP